MKPSTLAPGQRLQFNVLSNLSASVWLALVTLLAIPVLYRALGPQNYAVVGLYLLAIQWAAFLDLGLSPALGRFAAQQNQTAGDFGKVRFLLPRFETLTLVLAAMVILAGALLTASNEPPLPDGALATAFSHSTGLMILGTIALRLISNLYRAGLTGLELQGRVSFINSSTISLRFGLPILLAAAGALTLPLFFMVQVAVGLLEVLWFRWHLTLAIGSAQTPVAGPEIKRQIKLGLSIAGLGILWISGLQIDKLVMSTTLSATQFGHYTLAIQLASAVTLLTAPLQTAILPRMTALHAAGATDSTTQAYTLSCLACTAIGLASTTAILVCGQELLTLVAGSNRTPDGLYLVVALYAFSNALIAIMALSYALQNAVGELRWHWAGALLLSAVQIPLLYSVAQRGDVQLMAIIYLATMLGYVLLWLPQAHRRFLATGHWTWLRMALLQPMLLALPIAALSVWLTSSEGGVITKLVEAVLAFLCVTLAAGLSHTDIRRWLRAKAWSHA